MSSALFSPFRLRDLTLRNRVWVSPMCQYSAQEGSATDWHLMHLGQFAVTGPGLVMVEATAVAPEGRISPEDLGLYSDDNQRALERVVSFCRAHGTAALGIQLGHAGRKASTFAPWRGKGVVTADRGGWKTVAPSAVPFDPTWPAPEALDEEGLARVRTQFVEAARRAHALGFDLLELHMAHGYLLHQFLSPISNRRTDGYGGNLEGRMRFPLEVFSAVREAWPKERPLGIRLSATDWTDEGWTLSDSVAFASALKARGCDFVDASSGGIASGIFIDAGPGYQTHLAAELRAKAELATGTVGLISDPIQAEHVVRSGQADFVAIARGFLDDPHWMWRAASRLGARADYPPQYERARKQPPPPTGG